MSKLVSLENLGYELRIEEIINGGRFDGGYYHIYTRERISECDGNETVYKYELIIINYPKGNKDVMIKKYVDGEPDEDSSFILSEEEIVALYGKIAELRAGEGR